MRPLKTFHTQQGAKITPRMSSSSSPRQHHFRGSTAGTNILGAVHRMDSDSKKAENFSENPASHYDSFTRPVDCTDPRENPVEEAPYDPNTNLLAPRPQFRRYRPHPNENPVEEEPYDPKTNLLAPRPQFLRYRPYPELYNAQFFKDACFLHPHDEDASRNSVLRSPEIKDIQSASGKTMDLVDMNEEKEEKVALRKPVEEYEEEEEEEEEEYEEEVEEYEEEEEESSWSVSVSKVLFLVFMICALLHVSVLRSPPFGKDGGEMVADSRALLRSESYQNEVSDKSFMRSHFDHEHKETDSPEQRILVYNSLDANEIYDKYADLQIRNMYVWIQKENLEQQSSNSTECDEHGSEDLCLPAEPAECDDRVYHEDPVQKSKMMVTETPDAFADLQKKEIADSKVTSFQTEEHPVVEDVKKLRDDGIEGHEIENQVASVAEPVSQIFRKSLRNVWLKGAVFSLSIAVGISAVLRILPKVFKKCRRILSSLEEAKDKELKNLTSSSIVVEKSCSSLQNTFESSASTPTVRLLSEYLPEEFSSSGITRKRPARANQRSQKKERSISSAVQPEAADLSNFTDAPSFGSFTTYQNIKKRKSGGEEDKVVTSVRRSSRIRQMATSPR